MSRFRGRDAKRSALRVHARRRFASRLGVQLTRDLEAKIVARIRDGYASLVERQSNAIAVWELALPDDPRATRIRVVYDRRRRCVVTVLPQGETDARPAPEPEDL